MSVRPVVQIRESRMAVRGSARAQLESLEARRLLAGDGLIGQYFAGTDLTGPAALTRIDSMIDFDWDAGSPAPELGADFFSVRWSGQVEPAYSETYIFSTFADDGVRLWIDNELIIDDWAVHAPSPASGAVTLKAGRRHDIQLEYFDQTGDALVSLSWQSLSQPLELIPTTRLYSNPVGAITGFTLFDADIDAPIGPLPPGSVIDISQLPTKNLSIRADHIGVDVESVRFQLSNELTRVENSDPFMMAGNNEANIYPWVAKEGSYTLTVSPFGQDDAKGARGIGYSMNFTVIDPEVPPPQPTNLAVRSTSDRDITLMWTDHSGDAASFRVERSMDGKLFFEAGSTPHEIFTDSSLNPRTRYHYRIKAFNNAGESDYTSILRVRTDDRELTIPGFPDASTTGPSNPAILAPVLNSFSITQNGAVVENFRLIQGTITIAANNVTIRNFIIENPTGLGAAIRIASSDYTGTLVEDGEIFGGTATNGVSGSNYTARRLHIHHMASDAFRVTRNVLIEGCYVHDIGLAPESHGDGVQMFPTDGGNIAILNNHIDARGANSALFQVNGGWRVGGNYFNGGNYTIQAGGEVGTKFINNTFGRAAKYGIIRVGSGDKDLLQWWGNVWADTGQLIFL